MTKYNPRSLARLLITCLSLCLALWLPLISVQAGVLLDLVNPPGQNNTPYALTFNATLPVTTLALSGYQQPAALWTTDNGVFLNGAGANLLSPIWTYSPAASGADAYVENDGSSVPALFFEGTTPGSFDTFYQFIATTVGDSYTYQFYFSNNPLFPYPSALLVTVDDFAVDVPEPISLALFSLGLLGLGWSQRKVRI